MTGLTLKPAACSSGNTLCIPECSVILLAPPQQAPDGESQQKAGSRPWPSFPHSLIGRAKAALQDGALATAHSIIMEHHRASHKGSHPHTAASLLGPLVAHKFSNISWCKQLGILGQPNPTEIHHVVDVKELSWNMALCCRHLVPRKTLNYPNPGRCRRSHCNA